MTFIETYDGESEQSVRAAVEELLSREFRGAKTKQTSWPAFTIGPVEKYDGRLFREFQSIAGSLHCWLQLRVRELGWSRAVLTVGHRRETARHLSAWLRVDGQESVIEPFDLERSIHPVER